MESTSSPLVKIAAVAVIAFAITVRMNDGSVRTVTQRHDPGVSVGDNARVVNGSVVRA